MKSEEDETFERELSAWFRRRIQELLANPDSNEFKLRFHGYSELFDSIWWSTLSEFPEEQRYQIRDALLISCFSDKEDYADDDEEDDGDVDKELYNAVEVTQLVEHLFDNGDREDLPAGSCGLGSVIIYRHPYGDGSEDEVLDWFHHNVAIGCLDDFEIKPVHIEPEATELKVDKENDVAVDYGSNAGVRCDTDDGPCACGAWH